MKVHRASESRLCARLRISAVRSSAILSAVGLGATLLTTPAPAQTAATASKSAPSMQQAPIRICGAAFAPAADPTAQANGPKVVNALCWGTWLVLGRADTFRVSANPKLEATIVELRRGDDLAVWLLHPDASGRPFVENISSTIANAAGRTRRGRLDGLALDLDQFAFTGHLGIGAKQAVSQSRAAQTNANSSARTSGIASQVGESSPTGIEISDYLAQDAARLAAAKAQ